MSKIKKIKILKNKVTISFYDHDKLELDKDVFTNFYLYEGKEVSKKELNKIESFNQSIYLWNYALKLRQKKLYSEYAMREKLYAKGGKKEEVDEVIKRLKKNDLIDDNAYIEDFIEYCNSLLYGKEKIISKLLEKGIFMEKISKVSFPKAIEKKKAKALLPRLEKKYAKYNNIQKKNHIYQAYIQAGYESDIANEMINHISMASNKEENEKLKKDYQKVYTRLSKKYEKKELKMKLMQNLLAKGYNINEVMKLIERSKL